MARAAETYRSARRNAEFGRKPKGNTWPRLARIAWHRELGCKVSRPSKEKGFN